MSCQKTIFLKRSNQNEDPSAFSIVHNENAKIIEDALNDLKCVTSVQETDVSCIKSRITFVQQNQTANDVYFDIQKNPNPGGGSVYTIRARGQYATVIDMQFVMVDVRTYSDEKILCPIIYKQQHIDVYIDNDDDVKVSHQLNPNADPNNKKFILVYVGKGFTSSNEGTLPEPSVITKTSQILNDGEDGSSKYVTEVVLNNAISNVPKITKTSQLTNDGEDGTNKYITLQDILPLVPEPTYIVPVLTGGYNVIEEIGTSIPVNLSFTYTRNDAGDTTEQKITKNGAQVATALQHNETLILKSTIATFTASVSYNAATPKNNVLNLVDNRNVLPAGTVKKEVTYRGVFARFVGPSNGNPRTLQRSLDTTNTVTLKTGTSSTQFSIYIASNRSVTNVVDQDALNANITSQYVLVGNVQVPDASGTLQTYKHYQMTIAAPYSSNHRHAITLR